MSHKHPVFPWGLAFIALLTVTVGALNWTYHNRVKDDLQRIEQRRSSYMLTTTWISGGKERSWTTTWKQFDENEKLEDVGPRHKEELRVQMMTFPEDK